MRSAKLPFVVSVASASFAALWVVACGGSSASAPGPASASNVAASTSVDGGVSSVVTASSGPTPSNAPTTTVVTLADGGDVQGTKLQSAQSSAASADVATGPGNGPHASEPGRSVKDIQAIIQSHRDAARACYDQAQSAHPDPTMKGNLDIRWTIDPTGKVTAISVDDGKSDIHDAGIAKCVMDVVRGLTFAVSGKGFETQAHYPFNFNPHGSRGTRPTSQ